MSAVIFTIEGLRLRNTSNLREHWSVKARRAASERMIVGTHAARALRRMALRPPYEVTIVRIGPRKMDRSNLYVAAKHVEDSLAEHLSVNDGDEDNWLLVCKQEPTPKGAKYKYAVRIEIRTREEQAA